MITTLPNTPGFVLHDRNGQITLVVMRRPPAETLDKWRRIYNDYADELTAALDEYFPEEE